MGSTPHRTASAGSPVVVRALVAAAASVLLLTGCTTGGNMANPGSTPTQPSATPSGSNADVPPKRWAAIISDLTARGVPTDSVALVSARSVTWNDGSLGCPKPGQSYIQSLIPGMQVVVTVGAVNYDYRFGRTDNPVLCQR
jgi:hypothetical protein